MAESGPEFWEEGASRRAASAEWYRRCERPYVRPGVTREQAERSEREIAERYRRVAQAMRGQQ